MRKSLKVILTMVITIIVVGYSDMLSVDAETVAPSQAEIKEAMDSAPSVYLSVNEYNLLFGHEELIQNHVIPRVSLSAVKTQSKTIITSLGGMNMGQGAIQYQTFIQSGRPKFAVQTVKCKLPPQVVGAWQLVDTYATPSEDLVHVSYTYSTIIPSLTDYATLNFLPN